MAIKKFYRNLSLPNKYGFQIEYGNASKETKQVVCLVGKTYVSTIKSTPSINGAVDEIMGKFKKNVSKGIRSTSYSDNFIFDYDFLKTSDTDIDNKILTFELYLNNNKTPEKDNIPDLLEPLLADLESSFVGHNFSLSETKQ